MPRKSKEEVLRDQIVRSLAGRVAPAVTVRAKLTGSASDAWIALRAASEGLGLGDAELLALLVMHGSGPVREALQTAPRPEGQGG